MWSGDLIFCTTCGAYAEVKAVKLKGECSGKPKFDGKYGGAWGQHKKLVFHGKHPRTNEELPPPKRFDGTLWKPGAGTYSNLKASVKETVDDKFYTYVPEPPKVLVPQVRVTSVQQLVVDRLQRVQKRQREAVGSDNENGNNGIRRRVRSKGLAFRG